MTRMTQIRKDRIVVQNWPGSALLNLSCLLSDLRHLRHPRPLCSGVSHMLPSRRDVLRAVPAALPFLAGRVAAQPAEPPPRPFPGMTLRMELPRNEEFPFGHLSDWTVPTEHFFVRSHFAVPPIDPAAYKLTVEGHVENPLSFTLDEFRKLPAVTKPLLLECAGNGRVYLVPQARGLQWGLGAVGNATWAGVPLGELLDRAKVKAGAAEVVLVGADTGAIAADPATPGAIHFDRSLPLAKARRDEVLLAHAMNGQPLTAPHGAPVRAVVGGWYGMASVKWLTRIVVTDRPHEGYWQTMDYSYWERRNGLPEVRPVTTIQPKASIARPTPAEFIPAGKPYRVFGAAWAGENKVAKVEVTADGGKTWFPARLTGDDKPHCWRFWEFDWTPTGRGPVKLVARCTDDKGGTQPEKRDPDRRTYMINHLVPVEVVVR
jgi:DMSO/TMAO reductase YedYZ molybdopterin-dependent catalytic subunit